MPDNFSIKDIRSNNPNAFKALVENHQDKVINTCHRFLNNREDAEDAAQEVFIEVYKSIDRFREESKLSTWIYRIAVTKSLDMIRKQKRKKRFGKLQQMMGFEYQPDQIPDKKELNPLDNTESIERYNILHQAIDALVENQKVAITLSKLEGFSNNEIADIMETSQSSVDSLIHRAKKNLYNKLYRYYKKNNDLFK